MRVYRWAALPALYLVLGLFLILGPFWLSQARANETEEQQLLNLINQYRQDNGVGPLAPSGALSASAEHHSQDMSKNDFFSHNTKESSFYPEGSSPAERAALEGYPTDAATAENIAWGQPTAEEVFQDWRRSPEHDAAMLDGQYTTAGIGHAGDYWTADFGSVADNPSTLKTLAPADDAAASDTGHTTKPGTPAEPTSGERTPTSRPADAPTADEQASDERNPTEQASGDGPQPGETQPATEPGEEVHTTINVEHHTSHTAFNVDVDPQYAAEEDSPPTTTPPTTNIGATSGGPAQQAPISQPWTAQQHNDEQATDGQTPPAETPPAPVDGGGAVPRPALAPTDTSAEQHDTGGTSLGEALRPSSTEQTDREPVAGAPAQPPAPGGEATRKVSPAETEAMENALSGRGTVPDSPVRPTYSALERPTNVAPAAAKTPLAVTLGAPGGSSAASVSPVGAKELPRTSGVTPLPLFLGCFLVLSGMLVYAIHRRQRRH